VGCKWAAIRTYALCFRNSRTATRVSPRPTKQPYHPIATCAAHSHRRIDRPSNSVKGTVTVPNTQQSTTPFIPNRAVLRRLEGCEYHYAVRAHKRAASNEGGTLQIGETSTWAANVQLPGRTYCVKFQNCRTATGAPSPTEQIHRPIATLAAHRHRRID
jgi:hypothetical protein